MSVVSIYQCNGYRCSSKSNGRPGGTMPKGWSRARGFITQEDRQPRQGNRPVIHFCPNCTKARDDARVLLGKQRLRSKI